MMMHPNLLTNLYPEELYKIKPKVSVVIAKPWNKLTEDETTLLQKILAAVKLSLPAVQIITREEFSLDSFRNNPPSHIIAFGAAFQNSDKMYENISVDGTSVVVAHDLGLLDDARKKNLWITLKQIFHS
jgi:hypothetical protein